MDSPFSDITQWKEILNQAGTAQDVVFNLLLPIANTFYSYAGYLLALAILIGIAWLIVKILYSADGSLFIRYLLGLFVVSITMTPVHTYIGDPRIYHSASLSAGGPITPIPTTLYSVPFGFYAITRVTNAFEDYLYSIIDQANTDITSTSYNGIPVDAYQVFDEDYARSMNDTYLANLYMNYENGCRYLMNPVGNSAQVPPYEWYGVGFMGAGTLGTHSPMSSAGSLTAHHLAVDAKSIGGWLLNSLGGNAAGGSAMAVTQNWLDTTDIDITDAAIVMSQAHPQAAVNVLNNSFANIPLKSDAYWQARFSDTPLPDNIYDSPEPNWYTVIDPSTGKKMGIPTSTTEVDAAGHKYSVYTATDCLQMFNIVDAEFANMRDGLNLIYNVPTGCYNGGSCLTNVANANAANASMAQDLALDSFMNVVANAENDPSLYQRNDPTYNGQLQNGEGHYAARMALGWKSAMTELGNWILGRFQVPLVCITAVGALSLAMGMLLLLAPIVFALSALPERLGTIWVFLKLVIFLKLTVWLMYVIFTVGGYVTSSLLQATLNGSIGNMSGASSFAAVAYSAQTLVIVGVLFGAPRLAYMLVYGEANSLSRGIGQGSSDDAARAGEAAAAAAAEVVAGLASGGVSGVAGAAGGAAHGIESMTDRHETE